MFKFGLQTRLILLTIIPTLCISVIVSIYFIQSRTSELEQDLHDRGFAMLEQFTPIIYYPLHAMHSDTPNNTLSNSTASNRHSLKSKLQGICNRIIEQSDVRAATIYGPNGSQLAHAGPMMLSIKDQLPTPPSPSDQPRLYYSDITIRFVSPVMDGRPFGLTHPKIKTQHLISPQTTNLTDNDVSGTDEAIGWIEIELSEVNTLLKTYQLYLTVALVITIGFMMSLFFGIRLSRRITAPLTEMIRAVDRVKDGHLDTRIHTNAAGELHQLETGINSMVESLKVAHEELKQSVDQATEDLRETLETIEIQNIELDLARKEALEASRIKSEFLANMSHEIRTPLNGILGFTKLLLKTQVNPRQLDYLSTINKSSESLLAIINDILDFSKIEAGKLVLDYIPMNLPDLVEEVITMVAPMAHDKQLEVVSLVYGDVPSDLIGDPLRLKQIITNLVNNAIKFTETGNIILRTMLESLENKTAIIKISVTDTGIGLTEEDQKIIFEAFKQADTSAARRFGGTGLGLVISKHLVEQMGGAIGMESETGKGSTFWFTIRMDINPNSIQSVTPAFPDKRIVLCDSNPFARLSLRHMLEHWSISVKEVTDLESLASHLETSTLQQNPYDAMIVGLDPKQPVDQPLADQMRSIASAQAECPCIILANTSEHFHQHSLLDDMGDACIAKPVRSEQLYHVLDNLFTGMDYKTNPMAQIPSLGNNVMRAPNVLCVDDNAANLKLICTLLEELGVNATACDSGMQALEYIESRDFDLIFMDIQMPVMDGVETTKRIRAMEGRQHSRATIIALTAHVLTHEKQALLKSNMDDVLSKPISEQQIIEILQKWTGYEAKAISYLHSPSQTHHATPKNNGPTKHANKISSQAAAPTKPDPHYVQEQPANEIDSVVDLAEGLRLANGKADLADDMLIMLLDSLPIEMSAIKDALEAKELGQVLHRVHKLHGATRYCGVPKLRQATKETETDIKLAQTEQLKASAQRLYHQMSLLMRWRQAFWSDQSIPLHKKAIRKRLGTGALESNEMEEI